MPPVDLLAPAVLERVIECVVELPLKRGSTISDLAQEPARAGRPLPVGELRSRVFARCGPEHPTHRTAELFAQAVYWAARYEVIRVPPMADWWWIGDVDEIPVELFETRPALELVAAA